MKVAYQGETGAFSEVAVDALYPEADRVPLPTFEAVFEAVENGDVDRGVIPIENSLHGSVHQNYDLLTEHNLVIERELHLRIRHALLSVSSAEISCIQKVYSHPQALGQCRLFLKTHLPDAEIVPAYDTAGAAKMVAAAGSPNTAAIASARAGDEYGLTVLADGIESNHQNFTRFLALRKPPQDDKHPQDDPVDDTLQTVDRSSSRSPCGNPAMKTSILYAQKENVPGGLFKSLAVFALRDIDLFKIESRPLVGSPGKYLFYLDLAGSADDESVTLALRNLAEIAARVTILGTYPVGITIDR